MAGVASATAGARRSASRAPARTAMRGGRDRRRTSPSAAPLRSLGPWRRLPVRPERITSALCLRLVGVLLRGELQRGLARLLEMPSLNFERPLRELTDPLIARLLVHLVDDLDVPELAGLGHDEELEPLEAVGVVPEV